jgi:hypothetical protein
MCTTVGNDNHLVWTSQRLTARAAICKYTDPVIVVERRMEIEKVHLISLERSKRGPKPDDLADAIPEGSMAGLLAPSPIDRVRHQPPVPC